MKINLSALQGNYLRHLLQWQGADWLSLHCSLISYMNVIKTKGNKQRWLMASPLNIASLLLLDQNDSCLPTQESDWYLPFRVVAMTTTGKEMRSWAHKIWCYLQIFGVSKIFGRKKNDLKAFLSNLPEVDWHTGEDCPSERLAFFGDSFGIILYPPLAMNCPHYAQPSLLFHLRSHHNAFPQVVTFISWHLSAHLWKMLCLIQC